MTSPNSAQIVLPTTNASTPPGWLDPVILGTILLACTAAMSPNATDADLWGHVQYGRDALEFGFPATTTYSYTAEGFPWVNHENLSEILLALGVDTLGPVGLLVVKMLLGSGLIGLVLFFSERNGASLLTMALMCMVVAINLAMSWTLRPQLVGYICYATMLVLLGIAFRGWEGTWQLRLPAFARTPVPLAVPAPQLGLLWLMPIVFLVWANAHGGFIAGLCVFGAYLGGRALEAISLQGMRASELVGRVALLFFATVLATFVNPYGYRLHAWLLHSLSTPYAEIVEWNPPNPFAPTTVPFYLISLAFLVSLLLSRKQRDFTQMVVMGAVLWQAIQHQRHVPFFAIPFGFWMAGHLESGLLRLRGRSTADEAAFVPTPTMRRAIAALLIFACLATAYRLHDRLHVLPVQRREFPVSAAEFIARRGLTGRMLVTYNWSQYLLAAFGPRHSDEKGILVGFDGRFDTCYPREVVDMHFDFILGTDGVARCRGENSPEPDPKRALDYGSPDLVLIHRYQPHSVQVMRENQSDWVLLYQDRLAQLWGRATKYDRAESPLFIPAEQRSISDAPQNGSVPWPAIPPRKAAVVASSHP